MIICADRRPARVVLFMVTLVAALAGAITGCAAAGDATVAAGAPSPVTRSGPSVLTTRTLPSLVARPTTSATESAASTATASPMQPLVDAITAALADPERVPPNVGVNLKAEAGNQLVVTWIVNTNPNDPNARLNARRDAVTIMTVVREANIDHGSVLLNATGAYLEEGKRKDTVVVRAKYTRPLVLSTDWATVPPDIVFTLCDDKPAVIVPAFA